MGYIGVNGIMENGNYYSISGLYADNGKENGNYYNGVIRGYIRTYMDIEGLGTKVYGPGVFGGLRGCNWGSSGGLWGC